MAKVYVSGYSLEVLVAASTINALVSGYSVEALIARPAEASPTTVTGAGVSVYGIEALIGLPADQKVRVSQYAVEVLMQVGEVQPPDQEISSQTRGWVSIR
jgi:hypothetical protein